jgi:lipopolysaccharide transport system permease protein
MLVFAGVFGSLAQIPSEGYPYPVWVYAGLVPWTFFANAVTASGASLLGATHLVTKVFFPRLLLPLAALGVPFVDFGVATLVLFGLVPLFGLPWSWMVLLFPLMAILLAVAALGVGLLVAAYSAVYRDLQQLLPFGLQLWLFLTPVVYPPSLIPEAWRWVVYLNPVAGFLEGFRSLWLGKPFDLLSLGVSSVVAILLLLVGLVAFERRERQFADFL